MGIYNKYSEMMKTNKELLFENMHKVAGMPLNENTLNKVYLLFENDSPERIYSSIENAMRAAEMIANDGTYDNVNRIRWEEGNHSEEDLNGVDSNGNTYHILDYTVDNFNDLN